MRAQVYLVITKNGVDRMVKSPPRLGARQLAITVDIEVPDRIFDQPTLRASFVIPKDALGEFPKLILENRIPIQDAVRIATGMEVVVTTVSDETPPEASL